MPWRADAPVPGAAPRADGHLPGTSDSLAAPVIVLSYGHSGAHLIQRALADGTDLACTEATGILPLCDVAAATWARVDGRPAAALSQLARSSIRALVTVQLSVLLTAASGRRRWCELATSPPSAAQAFLQVFPAAQVVCVHRACTEVISAAIRAQRWGLGAPGMSRFAASYPGNNVAAVAAYWASATEQLLAFEAASPRSTSRVRYEDVLADTDCALNSIRAALHLNQSGQQRPGLGIPEPPGRAAEDGGDGNWQVPVDWIPAELRRRVDDLHGELGYPPAAG
jgi:hypothetical protein